MLAVLAFSISSCGAEADDDGAVKLSFKSAATYAYLKELDGKKVTINGYMATSSPADGSFLFLMNLPYQNCPFCKPNTSLLSNTMEVYPKKNRNFGYTTQAIKVVGTLNVAATEDDNFTDPYGYEFNFKIVDAEYFILDDSELTEELALWQRIASTDVISEIYRAYDYVYFLCAWDTYFVNNSEDADGNKIPGYYLYAADAENYVKTDGAQFNYGYQYGYFEDIIKTIKQVDNNAFNDLVDNLKAAKALGEEALSELEAGSYSYEYKYVEKFDNEDYVYTFTPGPALTARWDELWMEFTGWLGSWEM